MEKFETQIEKLEAKLQTFEGFKNSDEVIVKVYDLLKTIPDDVRLSKIEVLKNKAAMLGGYYAYLEPIANRKNAEANIAYIGKKRYQAGTYLRIKNEMDKVTNETAKMMTDNETYEQMAYETEKRLEADNWASICETVKMFVSLIQSVLRVVGNGITQQT